MPEETLNVLITVMSEGELHVPRLGAWSQADAGFRLVAAMNPFDAVGTARDLRRGVRPHLPDRDGLPDPRTPRAPSSCGALRRCRTSGRARPWSSWSAARANAPGRARSARPCAAPSTCVGVACRWPSCAARDADRLARRAADAALVALSGRIRLVESCARPAEEIVRELYARCSDPPPRETRRGRAVMTRGKPEPAGPAGTAPSGAPGRADGPHRQPGRAELSRHPQFAEMSPQVGMLDEQALTDVLATAAGRAGAAGGPDHRDRRAIAAARAAAGGSDRPGPARRRAPRRTGLAGCGRSRPTRGGDLDIDSSTASSAQPPPKPDARAGRTGRPRLGPPRPGAGLLLDAPAR